MSTNQQINGNQIYIGTSTDLTYGQTPSNVNVPNILSTDKLPDAIDKLIGIIDKLAPSKSPFLSTKYLSLVGTFYTARHVAATSSIDGNVVWSSTATQSASTASTYAYVFFGNNPVVRVADSSSVNQSLATFSDGQTGYLQADIDYQVAVQKTLDPTYYTSASGSTSVDVGQYGGVLSIVYDGDPYTSAPNMGFWTSLKATMSASQSFVTSSTPYIYDGNEHIYQMSHETTGSTPIFRFICDNGDATPPSVLLGVPYFTVYTQSNTRYTSGIPSLAVGDYIAASYSVANTLSGASYPLISRFYNQTRITNFQMYALQTVSKNDLSNGIPVIGGTANVPYAYQPIWSVDGLTVSVVANMYDLDADFSFTTYNPKNISQVVSTTYNIGGYGASSGKKLFIDTLSDESTRYRSGRGQFPTFGSGVSQFGVNYAPTYSLISIYGDQATVDNEMMLRQGRYQYPDGDYSQNYPIAGINYTYTTLDNSNTFSGTDYSGASVNYIRWATFKVTTISSKSSVVLTINGSSGISTYPTTGMLMYVTVVNSGTQQIKWVDANSNYSGVGNPGSGATDGDAAMVNGSSTATSRYVTFGTATLSGDVWVRIGFPSGSTKYFTSIS